MTFQSRWWLPVAMAGSLVVACSSGGGNTPLPTLDGGTDDTPVTNDMTSTGDGPTGDATGDRPADRPADRPGDATTDRTQPPGPCSMAMDISSMMPGPDGAIHIMGNNEAGAPVTLGMLPMNC